jgi:hypothetical protein
MANVTVTTDVDNLLKSADNAAARTSLGLGTAAEAATGDFATAAEGILAGTALQPSDPTLESVTDNGSTTLNNIQVGRIATLHPTNSANHNIATGNSSASIGGTQNQATGNRTVTFGGRSNQVTGSDSSSFGGLSQTVKGHEAEAFGGTSVTLNTKYTNTVGGANHVVGLAASGASTSVAKHSITVGGENSIIEDAQQSAVVAGDGHKVQTGHHRSVILGGANITSDASDTAYVPNLNVGSGFKMPTGAVANYVLTTDANGAGTWQVAGGGGGTPEGTSILSTGETGGAKFLREDGDGTCSWQTVAGGGGGGTVQGTDATYQLEAASSNNPAGAPNANGNYSVNLQMETAAVTEVASGTGSTISGGQWNTASNTNATVGGGAENTASGYYATVSGGNSNTASGYNGTISGGGGNTASGNYSVIGGGKNNNAANDYDVIVGGSNNDTSASSSIHNFIGTGSNNTASDWYGLGCNAVVTGSTNSASGGYSFVGTGRSNTASGMYSSVVGGTNNTASGERSAILCGDGSDTNYKTGAMIVGDTITADRSNCTFVNNLSIKNIPTSATGLPSGSVWSDGGTLKIV